MMMVKPMLSLRHDVHMTIHKYVCMFTTSIDLYMIANKLEISFYKYQLIIVRIVSFLVIKIIYSLLAILYFQKSYERIKQFTMNTSYVNELNASDSIFIE